MTGLDGYDTEGFYDEVFRARWGARVLPLRC